MPDLGLTKAILRGIKGSKAVRPVEGVKPKPVVEPKPVIEEPQNVVAPQDELIAPPRDVPAVPEPPVDPIKPTLPPDSPVVDEEARRLSRASLGDYDLDEIHQTNFDTITTTDEIKAVIADRAEQNIGKIDIARRGEITNEQLGKLASELGSSEDIVQQVLERQSGQTLSPELILASRQVLNASADRLRNLAVKISTGQGSDIERIQFRRQMQFHDEYQTAFMGARAESGRALNAFGIPTGDNPQHLAALKQTVDSMYGRDTDDLARMVADIDSIEGVGKFTRDYTRSKLVGAVQELYINSILSGFRTQEVNTIGNAMFPVANIAETAVAAQMGKMLPGKSHVMPGEATALAYGAITGWRDALRLARKSFKIGESLDGHQKFEGHTKRAISAQNFEITSPNLGAAIDAIGTFIRLPTERGMAPTDEFFKAMAYRSELARMAARNAMERANLEGLGPEDVTKLVREFMDNPPPAAVQSGENYALSMTFQTPLGEIGTGLQKGMQNLPGGFIVAPFIRTPINLFKAGLLERSPLAVFSRQFREAMKKGGPERDMAVARVSMGTLTVASIAVAVGSGSITGGGPQNYAARKTLLASGWQPYSIRWEDDDGNVVYQSYARAEPFAYVIGATADAVEIYGAIGSDTDDLKSEQEQTNSAVAAIVAGVANNTMSKTFLSGVADFTGALDDPKRYMAGYLDNLAVAIVPYSAFRRQAAQLQDPLFREAWTLTEKLKVNSGIPGWSEDAPPRRDVFGQPMMRPSGSLTGTASIFPSSKESTDPVLTEIVRLQVETGTVSIGMPSKRVEGMKLTTNEYDQLVRISRSEPVLGGMTLHDAVENLMTTSVYLTSTPDFQSVLIKDLQHRADKAGRFEMMRENPEFAEKLDSYRYRKRSVLYGGEDVLRLGQ